MSEAKTRFEITVELTRVVIWPIFLLILMIVFWTPVNQIADYIPSLVKSANSIKIGNLIIKTNNNNSLSTADDESIKALEGISIEAMSHLVSQSIAIKLPIGWQTIPHYDAATINELIDRKLYYKGTIEPPLDRANAPIEEVRRTKLGIKVADLLRSLLFEMAKQ